MDVIIDVVVVVMDMVAIMDYMVNMDVLCNIGLKDFNLGIHFSIYHTETPPYRNTRT